MSNQNVFNSYPLDDRSHVINSQRPTRELPFIQNKLVTNTVSPFASLIQPHERGTFFGRNTAAKRKGLTK